MKVRFRSSGQQVGSSSTNSSTAGSGEQEPLLRQQREHHDHRGEAAEIAAAAADYNTTTTNNNMARNNLIPGPPSEAPPDTVVSFEDDSNRGRNNNNNNNHRRNNTHTSYNTNASSSHTYTPRTRARKVLNAGRPSLLRQNAQAKLDTEEIKYEWRLYSPDDRSVVHFFRWLMVGGAKFAQEQSDDEIADNLLHLARCLTLLRAYLQFYGMPQRGGADDQALVLHSVTRDLYGGGVPIWTLETFLQRVAEGLTGHKSVNWFLLPRKAFVFSPNTATTNMFKIDRGFNIQKLHEMEQVAVRLASFASNTRGVGDIPSRFPKPEELQKASREGTRYGSDMDVLGGKGGGEDAFADMDKEEMEEEILALASGSASLFFFLNSKEYKEETVNMEEFWVVSDEERELFSRLATLEAMDTMAEIDAKAKVLYPPWLLVFFRLLTAAGAVAFWFNGSPQDMLVAGTLAVIVGMIGQSSVLSKQERIVFEVVASFGVGITAGLIAIRWPEHTCFAAMALGGVLDILQGFRVVYAIIEIMSRHTVCGGADLLEGILFTGLIAYFLRFGQNIAADILGSGDDRGEVYLQCSNGINELWYILIVPITALSWSGSFTPQYEDLPLMCFHGVLGFAVNYGLSVANASGNLNNFVSALVISTSAGLVSRFTGRSAVAYTVAGLYVLIPGAYLVKSLFSTALDGSFFTDIIQRAIIIGLGAWSGTILCSPTLLGTTSGLLNQQSERRVSSRNFADSAVVNNEAMLFF